MTSTQYKRKRTKFVPETAHNAHPLAGPREQIVEEANTTVQVVKLNAGYLLTGTPRVHTNRSQVFVRIINSGLDNSRVELHDGIKWCAYGCLTTHRDPDARLSFHAEQSLRERLALEKFIYDWFEE